MIGSENQETQGVSIRLADIHDFTAKLKQPALRGHLREYISWRRAVRKARKDHRQPPSMPRIGPISINLDLSTACNFACTHCIDWDALNLPQRHEHQELLDSLRELAARGLKSVILLGGGEPTLYPGFQEVVRVLKTELRLQVAVVTNGSRNEQIAEVADLFDTGDWVRLSLDAGTEQTFEAMHRPKGNGIRLEEICERASLIKQAGPKVQLGYSFVITWRGAHRGTEHVIENLDEMALATQRARDAGFDYISFKPFLQRAEQGAEVLEPREAAEGYSAIIQRIEEQLEKAHALQSSSFRVVSSTNLRVLMSPDWRVFSDQPRVCHMQALRQVVSPLGVFNCPAHRGIDKARIGGSDAWTPSNGAPPSALEGTSQLIDSFDAHVECREVTCLYHPVNHWIEQLISGKEFVADSPDATEDQPDFFL